MSRRVETWRARAAAALWAVLAALRQTWRQPARRPVLAGMVVVPLAGLAALLFLPRGTEAQAPGRPSPAVAASASASAAAPSPAAAPARPASDQFRQRNPFRVRPNRVAETPPPTPAPTPLPAVPPPREPIDASTKLDLVGTFVMGKDRYAVVVIKAKQQEVVVKEDESPLPNSRIIRILPREVRMLLDGQEAVLKLDFIQRGQGGPVAAAPPPAVPNPYAQPPGVTVPDVPQPPAGEGQARRLARSEVDQYLDNLNQLLTQVNVQPVFQAGQPSGFRLTDIQRGTILDQIGIQDGDTLRFVNGQRIDSVQSAFQLYNILKESTNVEITVIRNTRPVTLRYLIY